MKKLFAILIAFAVGFGLSACKQPEPSVTTLRIINQSSYDLAAVEYSGVRLGDGYLDVGKNISAEVTAGRPAPVYFSLVGDLFYNRVHCKTTDLITCEEGGATEMTITNNTIVTEIESDQRGTMSEVYEGWL